MKKKKTNKSLTLDKLTISRLNDLSLIKGGDGQDKTGKKSKSCPPPPPPSGPFCPPPPPPPPPQDDN